MKALEILKELIKQERYEENTPFYTEDYTKAITELEEAMKPKTCDGCVHEVEDMQDLYCAFCSRSCDDNFEPKDNA